MKINIMVWNYGPNTRYLKSPNMKMTPEWKARIESTEHNEQENTSQYCNVSQMNLAIVGNLWFMVQFSA